MQKLCRGNLFPRSIKAYPRNVGACTARPKYRRLDQKIFKKVIIIKNERGITLVALVVTIIVMLILASISVEVGIESAEYSKMVSFVSKMQLIQKKVDFLAENGGYQALGESLEDAIEEEKIESLEIVNTIILAENLNTRSNNSSLKYFSKDDILSQLEIENIDESLLIDFSTREVISLNGVKYEGKMYYSQYNLPGGQTVKQNTTQNSRQIETENITITPNINGLNATFTISGIGHTNGTLSYSTDNRRTWTEITNYTVAGENVTTQNITKSGTYIFKWTDNTNTNNEYVLDTVGIRLTNSPQLKGNLSDLSQTYNYTALDSTTWGYATDNNETEEDETDDIVYVWIPRFAYETEDTTNIEFLRGTSNVTTKDTYIPETGWTIPEVFKDVTGVWVDVTDEYNADELDTLDIIDILDGATIL